MGSHRASAGALWLEHKRMNLDMEIRLAIWGVGSQNMEGLTACESHFKVPPEPDSF